MGCFSPDAPPPRDYGKETAETLQAQIALAPKLYSSESQYRPLYADLTLANINRLLQGSPGGTQTLTGTTYAESDGWYDAQGNYLGRSRPATPGARWAKAGDPVAQYTRTVETPAITGLLDLLSTQASRQRASDIADVESLGARSTEAMLSAQPWQRQLLELLNQQAVEGLRAGSELTPDEQRQMQQASRAAWAARGLSGTNAAIGDELLRQYNLGQQLLRQRQDFAGRVLGFNQAVVGDPFLQILGRPSSAVNQAQSVFSQSGPSLFNPESPYAGNLYNANQQMAALFAEPSTMAKLGQIQSQLAGDVQLAAGIAGMI